MEGGGKQEKGLYHKTKKRIPKTIIVFGGFGQSPGRTKEKEQGEFFGNRGQIEKGACNSIAYSPFFVLIDDVRFLSKLAAKRRLAVFA